jgi:hypothetical protein
MQVVGLLCTSYSETAHEALWEIKWLFQVRWGLLCTWNHEWQDAPQESENVGLDRWSKVQHSISWTFGHDRQWRGNTVLLGDVQYQEQLA